MYVRITNKQTTQIFLRWINYRCANDSFKPILDLRDLFRTEKLISLAELCLGTPVEGAIRVPSLPADRKRERKKKDDFLFIFTFQDDKNYEVVVNAVASRTAVIIFFFFLYFNICFRQRKGKIEFAFLFIFL
jgi:hypothetical protein